MKQIVIFVYLLLTPQLMATESNNEVDIKTLNEEARGLVKRFASILKPSLKEALQTSGPVGAIKVCSEIAPKVARTISDNSGWSVKRVSLKTRNAQMAKPDDWERTVLQYFDIRQTNGEDVSPMMHSEIIGDDFRFMKAQGVEPVCLTCHGSEIKPGVQKALKEYYPNDLATGYQAGQVRGAFSLTKQLRSN